jgi:hypothetical protein
MVNYIGSGICQVAVVVNQQNLQTFLDKLIDLDKKKIVYFNHINN